MHRRTSRLRHRPRLVGRLVRPDDPTRSPGTGSSTRSRRPATVDRARALRLPADRPGAAARRARPPRAAALRRRGVRRAAPRRRGVRRGGRGLPRRPGCSPRSGARHLVLLPEQYTDMHSGDAPRSQRSELDPEQWNDLTAGYDQLGRIAARGVRRRAGLPPARRQPRRHPGADRAVPHDTDPSTSSCAWTPGTSPTAAATTSRSSALPGAHRLRPPQAGRPGGRAAASARRSCRSPRPCARAMVEPPHGVPAMPPLLDALAALRRRPLRDRRAGPVPRASPTSRCRSPTRTAQLPRRLRARPGPPCLSPYHSLTARRRHEEGTLDDEDPEDRGAELAVTALSPLALAAPAAARAAHRARRRRRQQRRRRRRSAASATPSR